MNTEMVIETHTRRFVNVADLRPEDIDIQDIAHALSNQCRFSGHTRRHYSVAEHSVILAALISESLRKRPIDLAVHNRIVRQALLHDATEAYLVDLPTPIKRAVVGYEEAEARAWKVIAGVFDVDVPLHAMIKLYDKKLCLTEKLALLSARGMDTHWSNVTSMISPFPENVIGSSLVKPEAAKMAFLRIYDMVRT